MPVLESGLAIAEGMELRNAIVKNAYPLAYVLFLRGRHEEGLGRLARASEVRGSGTSPESTRFGFLTASAHMHAGELAAAENAVTQGLSVTATRGEQGHVAPLWRLQAEVLARRAADRQTEFRLRHDGLRLATDLGLIPEAAHGHLGLSRFYRRSGDEARAKANLASALDVFRDLNMGWWLRDAEADSR